MNNNYCNTLCCPVCGNIEIEPEDNYCIICGYRLKEEK